MTTLHSIRGMLVRGLRPALPKGVTEKPSDTSIRRQVLRRVLLGLLLVPTLLIWTAVGTGLFGYQAVIAQGVSMQPTLRDSDALWVRQLDIADVKIGDIVTLGLSYEGFTTHRVIGIEPISGDSYLLTTKGDANLFTEEWRIVAGETVAVMAFRIPFGGYVLGFLASLPGITLVGIVLVALWIIWVRQRRMSRSQGGK